jgi:putative transposase
VFQSLTKGHRPTGRPLATRDVRRLLKALAVEARLGHGRAVSGHSLRVGMAQDLVAADLDMATVMQAGAWTPRTVSNYLPKRPTRRPRRDMRWSTFLRLHAQGIIACDFFVAVTATFRLLYVFVVIEHCTRRLILCNVTAHPTAAWTLQRLREAVGLQDRYEYLLHDRDSILANHLDESIERLGVKVWNHRRTVRWPMRSVNESSARFVASAWIG